MGKEGPFIHLLACWGNVLSRSVAHYRAPVLVSRASTCATPAVCSPSTPRTTPNATKSSALLRRPASLWASARPSAVSSTGGLRVLELCAESGAQQRMPRTQLGGSEHVLSVQDDVAGLLLRHYRRHHAQGVVLLRFCRGGGGASQYALPPSAGDGPLADGPTGALPNELRRAVVRAQAAAPPAFVARSAAAGSGSSWCRSRCSAPWAASSASSTSGARAPPALRHPCAARSRALSSACLYLAKLRKQTWLKQYQLLEVA